MSPARPKWADASCWGHHGDSSLRNAGFLAVGTSSPGRGQNPKVICSRFAPIPSILKSEAEGSIKNEPVITCRCAHSSRDQRVTGKAPRRLITQRSFVRSQRLVRTGSPDAFQLTGERDRKSRFIPSTFATMPRHAICERWLVPLPIPRTGGSDDAPMTLRQALHWIRRSRISFIRFA